jgi:tetratricopeptide (TPR) repeat protein
MLFAAWVFAQAATVPAASSLQARFEQASAALVAGKWDEALAGFQAIDGIAKISPRTRSIVLMREGMALFSLRRNEEARDSLRRGLDLAPVGDATFKDDRIDATLTLGGLERNAFDYPSARRHFEEAIALADDPATKLRALIPAAGVTMFNDNSTARGLIDQAVALAGTTKITPQEDAAIHDMRGRVLLNQGDAAGALVELQIALKDLGGLTSKTDLNDVAVRSDLALAALKAKRQDQAREYLAMTGEGRLPDGPFAAPADTDVPACGGELKPDDVAVVEFGIGDEGDVLFARPVYASRQGPMAVEFARAVSGWSWRPAEVKTIPPFYRALTRVELRCSTAAERPQDLKLLQPAFDRWAADNHATTPEPKGPREVAALRAGLDRKDRRPPERIVDLYRLAMAPVTDPEEGRDLLDQAASIAEQDQAPPAVLALIRIAALALNQSSGRESAAGVRNGLRALLAKPEIAADAQASDVIRLMVAAPSRGGPPSDAADLLTMVANDKRLEPRDPLRVGALVRLSAVQVQHGDLAAARATYERTGLSAQQCSLVDAKPAMRRVGVDSNDYPREALAWGIGGWTRVEFDVLADGRTVNRRAIMSYPPFVFSESTVAAMEGARYTQTYRPDGAIGCSGASERFRYLIPQH